MTKMKEEDDLHSIKFAKMMKLAREIQSRSRGKGRTNFYSGTTEGRAARDFIIQSRSLNRGCSANAENLKSEGYRTASDKKYDHLVCCTVFHNHGPRKLVQ